MCFVRPGPLALEGGGCGVMAVAFPMRSAQCLTHINAMEKEMSPLAFRSSLCMACDSYLYKNTIFMY